MIPRILALAGLAFLWTCIPGCGDDDDAAQAPANLGLKGETCQRRADCAQGLACVNAKCTTGAANVAGTANECVVVQCSANEDCCQPPPSSCEQLEGSCDQDPNGFECQQYTQSCTPDVLCKGRVCADNQCTFELSCSEDFECGGGHCVDSKCLQCRDDADCSSTEACSAGICQPKCSTDSDCPNFERCADSVCVKGQCKGDRECKAATRNAEAVCLAGECVEPCTSDLECGSVTENWAFSRCLDGQCRYVGCESDKECQLFTGQMGTATTDVKCLPKKPAAN